MGIHQANKKELLESFKIEHQPPKPRSKFLSPSKIMDFIKTKFDEITLTKNDPNAPNTIQLPAPTKYTPEFKQKYEFMKNLECATKEMSTNFMIQLQPTPAGRRKFNTLQASSGITSFVTGSRFGASKTTQHETKLADMMLEQANNLNQNYDENEGGGGSLLAACM